VAEYDYCFFIPWTSSKTDWIWLACAASCSHALYIIVCSGRFAVHAPLFALADPYDRHLSPAQQSLCQMFVLFLLDSRGGNGLWHLHDLNAPHYLPSWGSLSFSAAINSILEFARVLPQCSFELAVLTAQLYFRLRSCVFYTLKKIF